MVKVDFKRIWRIIMTFLVMLSMVSSTVVAPIALTPIVNNQTSETTIVDNNSVEINTTTENITLIEEPIPTTSTPIRLKPIPPVELPSGPIILSSTAGLQNNTGIENMLDITYKYSNLSLQDAYIPIIINTSVYPAYENASELDNLTIKVTTMFNNTYEINASDTKFVLDDTAGYSGEYWFVLNISMYNYTTYNVSPYIENLTVDVVQGKNIESEFTNRFNLTLTSINYYDEIYEISVATENVSLDVTGVEFLTDMDTVYDFYDLSRIYQGIAVIEPRTNIIVAELGKANMSYTLAKFGNVSHVLVCNEWNGSCQSGWIPSGITYFEDPAEVFFDIEHNSAYMVATGAQLEIWADTDFVNKYNDEPVEFFANYTQLDNTTITDVDGTCYIEFNVSGWSEPVPMEYNAGIWNYTHTFTSPGYHDYNITCNGTYTDIELTEPTFIDWDGLDITQTKSTLYDPVQELFNTTITITSTGPVHKTVSVQDLIDVEMNMTETSLAYLYNGTYSGTKYNGTYYIWEITVPSNSTRTIWYTTKPISDLAKTTKLIGAK